MPPRFPGHISYTNLRTSCMPTAGLGSKGAKGETKLLTPWALSICVTLGNSFNLSLPQLPQL